MKDRSCSPVPLFLASAVFVCGVSLFPSTAEAGFQWVAPVAQPAPAPLVIAPPSPEVTMPVLPPAAAVVDSAPQSLVPPVSQTQESSPAVVASPAVAEDAAEKPLRGFASDIPLDVALRQILPPDYAFTLGQDVDGGQLVSWQGGGLWRQTLQEMLRVANLGAVEQDKSITIVRAQGEAVAVVAPAPVSGHPYVQSSSPVSAPPPAPVADNQPLSLVAPSAEPVVSTPQAAPVEVAMSPGSAPQAAALVPMPQAVAEVWAANRGDSLRTVLEDWSKRANVQVTWQAEYDYPLQASVNLSGSYQDVVRRLLMGFQDAQPQPIAALHESADAGQSVLIVRVRGNNYSD